MNFNKFEQFEMTNAQTKKTVGGTQTKQENGVVRCLTAAVTRVYQPIPERATIVLPSPFDNQETGNV